MAIFKGKQVTVVGRKINVNDYVENFTVINENYEKVTLNDFKPYKYRVINVVPSLDTGVCDAQTRRVNMALADQHDIKVLTLSNDLPFAQRRWCGASGLTNVVTLSDYLMLDFALKFGTLIQEYRLLARSIFVVDAKNKVVYCEYVQDMSTHPNYDALLNFLNNEVHHV